MNFELFCFSGINPQGLIFNFLLFPFGVYLSVLNI